MKIYNINEQVDTMIRELRKVPEALPLIKDLSAITTEPVSEWDCIGCWEFSGGGFEVLKSLLKIKIRLQKSGGNSEHITILESSTQTLRG